MLTRYINLNIFYTDVEHSPTKAIYIKYYTHTHTHTQKHALQTHTHTSSVNEGAWHIVAALMAL